MVDTTEFEEMEKDGWSNPAIAKGYADGFQQATVMVAKCLADKVKAGIKMKVLDLCTGHGVVAAEVADRGANVTGLDFSEAMIRIANASVPKAEFVQGDAMEMHFHDGSFDAVTIGFGVPHFPDTKKGLQEAARVLKPDGLIALSIWHGKGSEGAFGWLFEAFGKFADPAITLPSGPDAHFMAERSVAENFMTDTGFKNFEFCEVGSQLKISSPDDLFDVFDQGAVRAASLMRRQPKDRKEKVRGYLADMVRLKGLKVEDGYLVPAPSVVISAVVNK